MKQMDGRTAVVTGAGAGIGRAIALRLAEEGCHLAIVDVDDARLEQTAELLGERSNARVTRHQCDVSNRDAVAALADDVVEAHGGCHILVNNAGVAMIGRFDEESLDDTQWVVGVNLWGVVHGCHAFLPTLERADEAHIVNVSSMVGLLGLPHNASYALTKGAVRMFSESLRSELRRSGVGVTVIHPGAINTGIIQSARGGSADRFQRLQGRAPRLERVLMTSPERVAAAVVRGIRRNRARLTVGPDARLVDAMARVAPSRVPLLGLFSGSAPT